MGSGAAGMSPTPCGRVAELVYAPGLGPGPVRGAGSSPASPTDTTAVPDSCPVTGLQPTTSPPEKAHETLRLRLAHRAGPARPVADLGRCGAADGQGDRGADQQTGR